MQPFKVFVGYDGVESAAYHTLAHSIIKNSSIPVSICPINLQHFEKFFDRPKQAGMSNEFSFSRFLVPYLCDYKGWALFMDCDMMMTADINDLVQQYCTDPSLAVSVVQHDYKSKVTQKYLGNAQENYPRKNWSSFVLWNAEHPKNKILTPELVAKETGKFLHRFSWLEDSEIGNLPISWNFLVGEYDQPAERPANIHWTLGGPWFNDYQDADYAQDWNDARLEMLFTKQLESQ